MNNHPPGHSGPPAGDSPENGYNLVKQRMVRLDNPHNLRIVYRYRSFCYALSLLNILIPMVINRQIPKMAVSMILKQVSVVMHFTKSTNSPELMI